MKEPSSPSFIRPPAMASSTFLLPSFPAIANCYSRVA
jgi:hypothetical protein